MQKLSKNRLKELKDSKNYTFKNIADKTGLPKSTVEKIFGGFNKNPTIESLQKIADVLECSIDDFLEYDKMPSSPFYQDRISLKYAQKIINNPLLKQLIDVADNLNENDLSILIKLAQRFKFK